jgi:lysophospholipase L1-like esterase
MFDGQFLKRRLEQDSHYFPSQFFLNEIREFKSFKALLLNRLAFIRERKQIMTRLFKKKRQKELYDVSKYYHGYIPFEAERNLSKKDVISPAVDPNQLNAFEELLNEFERGKIKVVFVQVPGYIPGRDSSMLTKNMELIQRIAAERNIPFFNYETEMVTEINYNREYYADWAHLNGKGSEAFSTLLKRDLEGFLKKSVKSNE